VGANPRHLSPLATGPTTRLLLQDPEGNEVLWVDFGVGLQELVELGICIRPGQLRSRAPGGIYSLSKNVPAWLPTVEVVTGGMSGPEVVSAARYVWVQDVVVLLAGLAV